MELKVQKSFNVVLQLDETEATQVAAMLIQAIDFDSVPLARELYDSLAEALDNPSVENVLRLKFNKEDGQFVHRGDK